MTVRAPDLSPASAARTEADATLLAWHRGQLPPDQAARILAPLASTAIDHANLGVVHRAGGAHSAAEASYRAALALDPHHVPAHYNLGNLLSDLGRLDPAAQAYRAAIRLQPTHAQAWNGLGLALQRSGALAAAVDAFATAEAHAPGWVEPLVNRGVALMGLDKPQAALDALRTARAREPGHAGAAGNLGALLMRNGYPISAEAACRAAIALSPGEHRWHANLAVTLQMQVRHREAEAAYREALRLNPRYAGGHGNLLFALNYREDLDQDAIAAEYRAWDAIHAVPLRGQPAAAALGNRRLRVGYVSADFRQHAVALFAEPLLAAHDRSRIEVFLYAELAVEDEVTARLRAMADHWRPTLGLDDGAVADMVRRDGIDVLVDMGGHTAGNRLLVFARKPAPVQLVWMIGQGCTTGLSAMDGVLVDAALAPPGSERVFAEPVVRLPRIPLAYTAPAGMPEPRASGHLPGGHVTFGHFGRPERLNHHVLATWSRILRALPGARLVLDNRSFQEPAFRDLFHARFAARGVGADRVELRYTTPQTALWASYGDIDIALDPFPHNAGTTTVEALWMGVPVLTMAGRPSVGRLGASILGAVGLDDWIATDVDTYVDRAVRAARDTATLAGLRTTLRARFAASPLADAPDLARHFEAAFFRLRAAVAPSPEPAGIRDLFARGDFPAAEALAREMLAADPRQGLAHHVLGLIAHRAERFAEAEHHLAQALVADPSNAEAHANHAAILRRLGRLDDAENAARTALSLMPDRAASHNNLGNILRDQGRADAAIEAFRAAVRLEPGFSDAWANLSWVETLLGLTHRAEESARRAIATDPSNANGPNNLGLSLMRQGRLAEAEATLREALRLRPDFPLAHSNILFCLNYRDDWTTEEIFAEYRAWDERHARGFAPAVPPRPAAPSAGRRLRVGYVSPDFRHHAAALFSEPLIAAHDRRSVEVFCYAELATGDATTERFRAMADHWRPTIGLDDDAVAAMIRADGIDVLVDLAGHTAGNRLLVFARKPAPVQLEFMLGHGYSSGLSAIDGFVADAALVPAGNDHLFSERVIRLDRIPLAFRPPEDMPPVAPLPAHRAGAITFGYFGRTVRLNDRVIEAWARILRAVPRSRLFLNSSPFAEPAGRELMASRFARHGIGAERLRLAFTTPQTRTWSAYGEVDIALDPFPHNAGTTTIEALWMGVPVVTLAGRPTVGRFGAMILHAVGLDDWVSADVEAYVARAVAAAADLAGLADLRTRLRPRFLASPLHDPPGLARTLEVTYRALVDQAWGEEGARLRAMLAGGDMTGAGALAEAILARDPHDADACHVAGVIAYAQGDTRTAAAHLRAAAPRPDVLTDLGVVLRRLGCEGDAEAAYRDALALDPTFGPALGNLGNLLLDATRTTEAEAMFTAALAVMPDEPWLLRGKALTLLRRHAAADAEALLRRALRTVPDDAEAHETLGVLLCQSGRPIEAEAHHRAALPHLPDRPRCLGNLAVALEYQGRHQEAEAAHRAALAERPRYASEHGNLLFSLNYRHDLSADAVFAEFQAWDRVHAAPLLPRVLPPPRDPDPARRLRIGYVSPDFRTHAVAHFALPWLEAHDRSAVEVFCYAEVPVEDDTTARFRTLADGWRRTVGLSDAAVADMISRDGIDIVVDLAGHTAGNRLLALARKPAPVQVEALLGLGTTTGIRAMDAFLADAVLAPPGAEAVFSERLVRLPRIPLAYRPPSDMPEVAPPPCVARGYLTFGYFGRVQRLNPRVIRAWAAILRAIPDARLRLNNLPFEEAAFRDLYRQRFAEHGIAAHRLELVHTAPQSCTWADYASVDIALDPFPHNAGTTTIEALWLGVPVLTLADRAPVGRLGAAILGTLGLHDWVAADEDAYLVRAVAAAADVAALAGLRGGLRARFRASALADAAGLARATEAAYRDLWRIHGAVRPAVGAAA